MAHNASENRGAAVYRGRHTLFCAAQDFLHSQNELTYAYAAVLLGAAIFFTAASPIIAPISWVVASDQGAVGCITAGTCVHECRPQDGYIDEATAHSQLQRLFDAGTSVDINSRDGALRPHLDAFEQIVAVAPEPQRRLLRFVSAAEAEAERSVSDSDSQGSQAMPCTPTTLRAQSANADPGGARRQLLGSGVIQDITQAEVRYLRRASRSRTVAALGGNALHHCAN